MFLLAPLTIALLAFLCKGNDTSINSLETLLHQMYERVDVEKGCGTPIKCIKPNIDAVTGGNESGPESTIPCCYDCDSCTGLTCYRGWQCCRKDEQGDFIIPEGTFPDRYGDHSNDDTTSCQKLYYYEKVVSNFQPFETEVNETFLNRMIHYRPLTYRMVSKCPSAYKGDETKRLCKHSSSLGILIDKIPYLSTDTLRVYRNRHCVICHHSNNVTGLEELAKFNFIPFDITLNMEMFHYRSTFINSFESVLDLINFTLPVQTKAFQDRLRIRFMASADHLRHNGSDIIMPPPCDFNIKDVDTCEAADRKIKVSLQQVCQKFYLPVAVTNRYTATRRGIVKNLACGLCIGSHLKKFGSFVGNYAASKGRCSVASTLAPYMLLNLAAALAKSAQNSNDPREEYLDLIEEYVTSEDNSNETRCDPGLFWDALVGGCRKILCPRRHYIVNGKCEPLFGLTVYYNFMVKVKATIGQSFGRVDAKNMYSLDDDLTSFLVGESKMKHCGTIIYAKILSKQVIDYLIFEVYLTPKEHIMYKDALELFHVIFDNDFSDVFLSRTNRTKSTVQLESGDVLFVNRTVQFPTVYDSNDGTVLLQATQKNGKSFFPKTCGSSLDITKQDYCYRMKLMEDEFDIKTNWGINRMQLKKSGAIIFRDNYDPLLDGSALVCIEDYQTLKTFIRTRQGENETMMTSEDVELEKFPLKEVQPADIQTIDVQSKDVQLKDVQLQISDNTDSSADITFAAIASSIFIGLTGLYLCKRMIPKIRDRLSRLF